MMTDSQVSAMKKTPEWMFYELIYKRIDEEKFKVLYSDKLSRPNSPVNLLVSSLILKELKKWTYASLFENIQYNILTRVALGLHDLSSAHFSESTLFLFLTRLSSYEENGGKNLIADLFNELTDRELKLLGIKPEILRTDSTFIDSNIRHYSRVQLLVEGLHRMWRILDNEDKERLNGFFAPYVEESSSHFMLNLPYGNSDAVLDKLALAYVGLKPLLELKYSEEKVYMDVFCRLLKEHITDDPEENIAPRSVKELSSDSLQSPDDGDATFRNKRGEHHSGYSAHITEAVDLEQNIALVVDANLEKNNVDDSAVILDKLDHFIESGAKEIHVDGGYGSEHVDKKLENRDVNFVQTAVKGRKSLFQLDIKKNENGIFEVHCPLQQVETTPTNKRYKAKFDKEICKDCPHQPNCPAWKNRGKYYFNNSDFLKQKRHESLKNIPEERRTLRTGIERTMHEMFHDRQYGKKLKYRGKTRIAICVLMRAISINFNRIYRWSAENPVKWAEVLLLSVFSILKLLIWNRSHENHPKKGKNQILGIQFSIYEKVEMKI